MDCSRLYSTADGAQVVVPMVRRRLVPQHLAIQESLPARWGTGGFVSDRPVHVNDVGSILAELRRCGAARVRVRPEGLGEQPWGDTDAVPGLLVEPEVKHVVDLSGGFERVWRERFRSELRTAVRKAERAGVEVESNASGRLVPVLYDLYLSWVRRRAWERRLPESLMLLRARRREPLRKFESIAERLGEACRIWVARVDGRPVASAVTLTHGTHASYWRGYSDKSLAGPVRANNLLQRAAIEYVCDAGCLDYNMGWSGEPSLIRFKRSFGAQPRPFPVLTIDRYPLTAVENGLVTVRTLAKNQLANLPWPHSDTSRG